MFHRLMNTGRLAMFGLLAIGAWQSAAAEIYNFEGEIAFCLASSCMSYDSLGGPGNEAQNPLPSEVSGFVEINVGPNGTFTEADIVDYVFNIFNAAVSETEAVFVDGIITNANAANPLPLDDRVVTFDFVPGFFPGTAIFGGSGTTGPNNELVSGSLAATFIQQPFNALGAQVYFDLDPANPTPVDGRLFGNPMGVQFVLISGGFSQLPGEISVADNPTVFADTALDDTAVAPITVTNTGDGPLTIESVATVDTLAAPFSITDDGCTGMTLPSMGSCVIATAFSPTVMGGMLDDSFDIVSDDPNFPSVTVDLTGTALEPNITITPATLTFVQTAIDDVSQAVATVRNTGAANLIIGDIDFTGLDPQFSAALDNCSTMTLTPTATCTIRMEFAPAVEGLSTSGFAIPSNDPGTPSLSYTIRGTGIIGTIAAITLDPESLTFDQILVGEMSMQSILLESSGNDPLTINSITLSDMVDFSQDNDCPAELASGLTCTIDVVFEPQSGGDKNATLTIDSNASGMEILPVDIIASAFDGPRIVVEPTELDLGSPSAPIDVGSSTTADVMVSNTGTMALSVGTLSIFDDTRGGVSSTEFTVANNGCTAPVAPMGSCLITVGFSPETTADKFAQLSIASDDVDNSVVFVDLTGYVFRGPRVDVPETTIDVDGGVEVEIGETASFDLVIGNSGTEDLDISGFALGGANAAQFSLPEEDCVGASVLPQGICTVTILFEPTSAGEKSASLSIFSNDVTLVRAMTIVVPLSATAVLAPPIMVDPPGSRTNPPPAFARADPGGGALGLGLLGLGLILLVARRRYR